MSKGRFDAIIHAPNRLQICALLSSMAEIEFKLVKEQLNVSDSVLSKHIKTLEEEGYVKLTKRTDMGRQRTWLSLTQRGLTAYDGHVIELRRIVGEL